jgi:hypothetical protein
MIPPVCAISYFSAEFSLEILSPVSNVSIFQPAQKKSAGRNNQQIKTYFIYIPENPALKSTHLNLP